MKPGILDRLTLALVRPWILLVVAVFLLTPSKMFSEGVQTGADFLRIGTGARPAALGGAYTAMASDIDAIYYNPGGLSGIKKREFGATHATWLLGTTFDFVGYAQPMRYGTIGIGVTRLGSGKFEGRDANGNVSGGFKASDTAYAISYGHGAFGGSIKLLKSEIGPFSAQTIAFDLGAKKKIPGRPLTLGAAVLNIGKGMQFLDQVDPLPLTFSVGAAYRIANTLNLAVDVRHDVHAGRFDVGIGSEYAVLPSFSLRAGYASQFDGASSGGTGGLSGQIGGLGGGFGIRRNGYRADYTFTPFGALGNLQRFSFGASF